MRMKKLTLLAVMILFTFSVSFAGVDLILTPIPFTLSATGNPIAITTGTQDCYGFSVILSDDSGWLLYLTADGSDTPTTISDAIRGIWWGHYVPPGTTVFYAKAVSGTPKLTLFPAKKVRYFSAF